MYIYNIYIYIYIYVYIICIYEHCTSLNSVGKWSLLTRFIRHGILCKDLQQQNVPGA